MTDCAMNNQRDEGNFLPDGLLMTGMYSPEDEYCSLSKIRSGLWTRYEISLFKQMYKSPKCKAATNTI